MKHSNVAFQRVQENRNSLNCYIYTASTENNHLDPFNCVWRWRERSFDGVWAALMGRMVLRCVRSSVVVVSLFINSGVFSRFASENAPWPRGTGVTAFAPAKSSLELSSFSLLCRSLKNFKLCLLCLRRIDERVDSGAGGVAEMSMASVSLDAPEIIAI